MKRDELIAEFERQVENLLTKGYPKAAGISVQEFLHLIEPLREQVNHLSVSIVDIDRGYLPFVIVVKSELVPTEKAMELVEKDEHQGITKLYPHKSIDFVNQNNENIPTEKVYLVVDIDRGKENRNIAPNKAMEIIKTAQRHPLTIDEGIAIITQYPAFLAKNNCFSLLASRHPKNKCVPAIWINANKQPNLGWCWEGNPHTWLGSASCGSRLV